MLSRVPVPCLSVDRCARLFAVSISQNNAFAPPLRDLRQPSTLAAGQGSYRNRLVHKPPARHVFCASDECHSRTLRGRIILGNYEHTAFFTQLRSCSSRAVGAAECGTPRACSRQHRRQRCGAMRGRLALRGARRRSSLTEMLLAGFEERCRLKGVLLQLVQSEHHAEDPARTAPWMEQTEVIRISHSFLVRWQDGPRDQARAPAMPPEQHPSCA